MSRKNKRSKEEIAKEFDLPERKSKIATIMKHDGEAYCLCRSSDCSRFMIGCDGCEEWYHGDCINISEKEAKHIKHYYCQRCKEDDPTLQTVFRAIPAAVPGITAEDRKLKRQKDRSDRDQDPAASSSGSAAAAEHQRPAAAAATPSTSKSSKDRCGQCAPCRSPNCGLCAGCLLRKAGTTSAVSGKKYRCERRQCVQPPGKTQSGSSSGGAGGGNTSGTSHRKYKSTSASSAGGKASKKRRRSTSPAAASANLRPINPELEGARHCYGPGCRMTARPQSKYCSDECGKRLAKHRIFRVLPQRIQEWNMSPSAAEAQNKRSLDTIRAKQATVRATLAELDKRHRELDLLVDRAKKCTLDARAVSDAAETAAEQDEQSMYCITCGHEIHSKTAIRHMEKCFNKYESQASFGSIFKTRIEGHSMFCDFYNAASQTYCKRLRVLCPEHSKDAKVSETDVCGCPLVRNTFELTGEFCQAPKKSCFRHYVWEKIRLAEIDLERVRQWLKMDELVEQERHVRTAMASRAGLLGLMLHSTYNHDIMDKFRLQQHEQQQQQLHMMQQQQLIQQQQQQLMLQKQQQPMMVQQQMMQPQQQPQQLVVQPQTVQQQLRMMQQQQQQQMVLQQNMQQQQQQQRHVVVQHPLPIQTKPYQQMVPVVQQQPQQFQPVQAKLQYTNGTTIVQFVQK